MKYIFFVRGKFCGFHAGAALRVRGEEGDKGGGRGLPLSNPFIIRVTRGWAVKCVGFVRRIRRVSGNTCLYTPLSFIRKLWQLYFPINSTGHMTEKLTLIFSTF